MRKFLPALALLAAFGVAAGRAPAAVGNSLEVSVVGQVDRTYKRTKLPDGTFKPEYYALANGGAIQGTERDASVEKVRFPVMALVVSRHLAKKNYLLAQKADAVDLLIVLHWGNTLPFNDTNYGLSVERNASAMSNLNAVSSKLSAIAQGTVGSTPDEVEVLEKERQRASDDLESTITMTGLENRSRDMANLDNAKILGYLDAINARRDVIFSEISGSANDLVRDIEEKRYYVTVSAYDFRALREKKKQVLRWVTRISIRASGNSFDERMAQMIASAASAMGQKSDLNRRFYGDPRVELRDVEYLGIAAPPAAPEAAGQPAK